MELKRTEDEIISLTTTLHSIQHRPIEWNYPPTQSDTTSDDIVVSDGIIDTNNNNTTGSSSPLLPSSLADYYSSVILSIRSCQTTTNDEQNDDADDGSSLANALEVLRRQSDGERDGTTNNGGDVDKEEDENDTPMKESVDGGEGAAATVSTSTGSGSISQTTQTQQINEGDTSSSSSSSSNSVPLIIISAQELCTILNSIRDRVSIVEGSVTKFRNRLEKKDPVTNLPRYGTKTASRVRSLLQLHDALYQVIHTSFTHPSTITNHPTNPPLPPTIQSLLQNTITLHSQTQTLLTQKSQQLQQTHQQHLEELAQTAETTRHLQEQAAATALREEQEELARRAEIARQLRLTAEREEVEAERAGERAVVDGVLAGGRGVEGVRVQIRRLVQSNMPNDDDGDGSGDGTATATITPEERSTALGALHTLFSQISSHPEEIKYRRVRRDHPQFREDIGRHEGGEGVLIAAGFRYGEVEGVKCLLSKEPDLERDMDGWSDWFDLMKKTVELIEEEMIR